MQFVSLSLSLLPPFIRFSMSTCHLVTVFLFPPPGGFFVAIAFSAVTFHKDPGGIFDRLVQCVLFSVFALDKRAYIYYNVI